MVNRVWQHHFGTGIVATSDNFGLRGERPTHPELLDWLTARFIESGWSVKSLHRWIVLSNAYRQSSRTTAASREADPEVRWLSSFPRRRLSAEELRDAMLAVSGRLDRAAGSNESGAFLLSKAEDINAQIKPNRVAADDPFYTEFAKRSVYLPIVRNMLPDVLALFDAADPNSVTAVRNETTVASQSLFLMNSPFVRTQAQGLAERVLSDPARTPEQIADLAHQVALGRLASAVEQAQAHEFVEAWLRSPASQACPAETRRSMAWQSYCQALLCSNEFSYVD
ncbi:MAG TPA: DUF1553 domain-containing protein, partial [Planctomycetaceae bacterium]|nr:DUF1553 domain-containing protein [Planctomycetaceae bacterium]